MTRREVGIGFGSLLLGTLIASAAWSLERPLRSAGAATSSTNVERGTDDSTMSLERANANLVASLANANRRIAALEGERDKKAALKAPGATEPAPLPGTPPSVPVEPTAEQWQELSQLGIVATHIPCVRKAPWMPDASTVEKLGLAPGDGATIGEAYAHSNSRMRDLIRPLCAKAVGKASVSENASIRGCIDKIVHAASQADAEATRRALVRVAETNAGKNVGARGGDSSGVEQLLLSMRGEMRSFETELASKLGPDEARRLVAAPEMCFDRNMLRVKQQGS